MGKGSMAAHWSIYSSVDDFDSHFHVDQPPVQTLTAIATVLPRRSRVFCEEQPDGSLLATTVKHTPGWAFVIPFAPLFVRRTERAVITATEHPRGSEVNVVGRLDSTSAHQMRQILGLSVSSSGAW